MKNKRLALLLAAVLTVTSADSTVMIASGADFSSEAVDVEEENPQTANEETPVDDTDEDSVEVGQETDLSSEETDGEVAVEGDENEETVDLGDGSEELFSDEAGEETESTSIVPGEVQELSLDTDYTVDIDEDNNAAWFSFTPEKDGTYIFSSASEDGVDPYVNLYDKKAENEKDYISTNDEGKGESNDFLLEYELKAGTTYYYYVREYYGRDVTFTVNLTEARKVASISVENIKTTLTAGFEKASDLLSECTVTVTYEDGVTYRRNNTVSFTDIYGNYIFPMLVENGEKTTFSYDTGLKVGKYGVCFAYEEPGSSLGQESTFIYSNIADVNVIPVTEADIYKGKISEGENTKEIQSGDICSFTPSKSGRYGFASLNSEPLDIVVKTESDGYYSSIYSQNGYCNMEAGTAYYIQNKGDSIDGVSVSEVPEIDSVTVDASKAKTVFQSGLETCYVSGLKLIVTYKDNREPEILTFKNEKVLSDSYGNEFRYYFICRDESYSWDDEPGSTMSSSDSGYPLKVTCNGEKISTDITITVKDAPKETLPELKLGENAIDSPDGYEENYYWFSPAENGKYGLGPVSNMTVKVKGEYGYDSVYGDWNGNQYVFSMKKGTVYCIGFYGSRNVLDESTGEYKDINNWDMTIEKLPEVVSITPSNTELIYTRNLDLLSSGDKLASEKLTLTYDVNGSTETSEVLPYFGSNTYGKYGSIITTKIKNENGEELGSDAFDENYELKAGTYSFTFECDGTESTPVTVKVRDFNYDSIQKLVIGKNRIKISKDYDEDCYPFMDQRNWYALETGDSSRYITSPRGLDSYPFYDILKKVDADGNLEEVWDYDEYNQGWKLEKNSRYVVCWRIDGDASIGDETELTLSRIPEVTSVKVKSIVPADMTFIKSMETVRLKSMVVEVTFDDGSTVEYNTENSWGDDYGRYVDCELATRNADGSYDSVEESMSDLTAGDYVYRISFDGVYAEDIPVKVINPSEAGTDEITQDKTTEIENKDRLVMKYTAKETGRYEVKFNVPVSEIKVRTDEGIKPSSSLVQKYKSYVNFEKDTTYYIYIKADEYCPELNVNVTPVTRPSGMAATALKKNYIAGIDRLESENFQTEVTLEDQKTRTIRGTDKVGGYYLQYKAQNKDTEKTIYNNGRLTTGTWEVTPYLSASIQTGSAVAVEMAEIPVTSTEITAEKMDLSKLPKFTVDQATELKSSNGERQWYAFTASESGLYYEEQQNENVYAEHLSFYRNSEDGYVLAGEAIDLEKGETCLVQVTTDQDATVKIIKQKNESGEDIEKPDEISELVLQEGMEKPVYLSAGKTVECTFTPEKDGYYVIKSDRLGEEYLDTYVSLNYNGEELTTNDDGVDEGQFRLIYRLEKGKTYTYFVGFYDKETAGAFKILFDKMDVHSVKDVKLVQKENASTESMSIFESISAFYEALVIYEDGTEQRVDLYGNGKINYGNRLTTDISVDDKTLNEKEVEYKVTFNTYSEIVEDQNTDFSYTIKAKGAGSLAAFELNKDIVIPEQKYDYQILTPTESGEYILTVKGKNPENVNSVNVYSGISTNWMGSAYFNSTVAMNYEGEATYSLHLEKGQTYYVGAYSEAEGNTISVKKAAKTLKGLKLLETPDQKTCLPNGLNVLSLKGLKAQAYYTDGTSENITYGTSDSSGRYLLHDGVEWINNNLCRAYVRLGKYQISFDLTADSWDNVQEIKAAQLYTPKAEKGDTLIYKFVPEKSAYYQVNVNGGYFLYVKAEDSLNSQYIESWYNGRCYMEEGRTYYLHIHADSSDLNFHVVPEGEPLPCEWKETDRKEATCTEEGQITRVCKIHGEKETETIPAKGHTPGEWTVTKEATAVAEGSQEQKCIVCDTVLQTKKIAKLKAKIKLNVPKTLPLKVKQTFQIKASGLAKGDKVASFKSSNTKIVTVTSSGKITGKKAGTATVTVKLKSGLTSQVKVKVQKSDVAATSVTVLNKSTNKKISGTVTLKMKKKLTLATTVAPVTCKQKVTFTSSNKKIATVTSSGVITAKKKGTVTITVKVGRKSAKVKIKVK